MTKTVRTTKKTAAAAKKTSEKDIKWDLSNVYKGLESDGFKKDWQKLERLIDGAGKYFAENGICKREKGPKVDSKLAAVLAHAIEILNEAYMLYGTLDSYIFSFYSTNSYDQLAARKTSELDMLSVPLRNLDVSFTGFVGSIGPDVKKLVKMAPVLAAHEFVILETFDQSKYLMSEAEERLASELSLSGGNAFMKLQGVVSSQLKVPVAIGKKTEIMPIAKVRNLAYDADEKTRKAAYEAELAGWESVKEPIAASINGVKGHNITINKHRGRKDGLHSSLDANRIDRKTLEALLAAMHDSFPLFRKYFKKKASRFGQKALPWWNLFAPAGKAEMRFSYKEACDFIVGNFDTFSPELGAFAARAFRENWIDVYPRDGKRGGAFCMPVPKVEESRILCNFDGSFEQVSTIAHELGHAFHNECEKGLTMMNKNTPMSLAETASIFCETIITNAAIKKANREQKLAILETQLINESQVIVDIYSRYLFEKEVFEKREKMELSADELCDAMIRAQKATYGDGLDHKHLHGYMWALKPHYYTPGLAFYNYPYAFGLLFALGLYEIFKSEGPKFVAKYKQLLNSTGRARALDLTKRFGIDISKKEFWAKSLKVSEAHVAEYMKL